MHECVLSATALKTKYGVRGTRRREGAARRGLPLADGVLPTHRRRGADVRADRDRERPDPRVARAQALERIAERAAEDPDALHRAPQSTPVSRVDEARAARHLIATADAER